MTSLKFIIAIILFVGINHTDSLVGRYTYSQNFFYESLQLNQDSTFTYTHTTEFTIQNLYGTYHIIGDTIVLSSHPKRNKMIVEEAHIKSHSTTFSVTNENGSLMVFNLTITAANGKKNNYKDCFIKVRAKEKKIKSFNIENTQGLKSPEYLVQDNQANFFNIQFESLRVFENEKWYIDRKNRTIRPSGIGGKFENYYLTKKE